MKRRVWKNPLAVQGQRLLKLYSYYSLILAILLLVITALDFNHSILGSVHPLLMLSSAAVYVLSAVVFSIIVEKKPDPQIATGYMFIEIVLLTCMMHASGGMATGFSSIIAIPVVMSNLLAPGLLGYGAAAWTTLAVLYTQIFLAPSFESQDSLSVGSYGFLCFILSWITQSLSHRLNTALSITSAQALRIQRLQQLSQQALQSLDYGVLASNESNTVLFINHKAQQWLELSEGEQLPDTLIKARSQTLLVVNNRELLVKKTALTGARKKDYVVTFEDTAQLAAQAQQLKLASLGRLTASIAHEVRNPLSAMKQAAQLLQETEGLGNNERQLTQIIEQQCSRLNKTIEDVLQLSRRKQASTTVIELTAWLESFIQEFQHFHVGEQFTLQLESREPVNIQFDPNHFRQIMNNLCANALRHAQQNSSRQAAIKLKITKKSPAEVWLQVIDNGGGVPEQQQQHLFEPFYTSEHTGTGLGLYLCRELCEANRAKIDYKNITNGACFRLRLLAAN